MFFREIENSGERCVKEQIRPRQSMAGNEHVYDSNTQNEEACSQPNHPFSVLFPRIFKKNFKKTVGAMQSRYNHRRANKNFDTVRQSYSPNR